MSNVPDEIIELSRSYSTANELSDSYTVKTVLEWFGRKRRHPNVLRQIQETLTSVGLSTEPPLKDTVNINSSIRFRSAISDNKHQIITNTLQEQNAPEVALLAITDDELEPEDGEEDYIQRRDDRPVTSQILDWTIGALREKLDRGQLDLQPKFQREYVWDSRPELPSRLIESLFLEIPVPPIYFGRVAAGRLEIIDGQQRLTTLINYVTNNFPLQKLNRMSSLNGKYFRDLTLEQQEKILDAPIRSIVIDSAGNTELRYEVFERLNRGSMSLNEQELRNCVYRGPFNDLLCDLEMDDCWRKIQGKPKPEVRFKEREMILRVFAFSDRLQQYKGNLKRFLNEYMAQYAPLKEQELRRRATFFKQTIQNIYAVFGENSARLYAVDKNNEGCWEKNFSVAALDIQFSALRNRNTLQVQRVAEQIRELFLLEMLTNLELKDAISKRTSSTAQTMKRWGKFRELVDLVVSRDVVEPRFFSFEFRRRLFDRSPICELCHNKIHSFDDCTVDHITPYSQGGRTVDDNGQLTHRACNASKNARMPNP